MDLRPRIGYRGIRSQGHNWLGKALAIVGAGVMLVSTIVFSFVLFTLALAAAVLFGLYFWWKTRHLRRQLRSDQLRSEPPSRFDGPDVIEGEVVRGADVQQAKPANSRQSGR